MNSFHEALAELYPAQLDRERIVTYGEGAKLRLVGFTARQYAVLQTLDAGGWMAWQKGFDQDGQETWRLEIAAASGVDVGLLKLAVAIDLVAVGQASRFKVTKGIKPQEVGLVYQLSLQPTGEPVVV